MKWKRDTSSVSERERKIFSSVVSSVGGKISIILGKFFIRLIFYYNIICSFCFRVCLLFLCLLASNQCEFFFQIFLFEMILFFFHHHQANSYTIYTTTIILFLFLVFLLLFFFLLRIVVVMNHVGIKFVFLILSMSSSLVLIIII